jgi:hypothetical protein
MKQIEIKQHETVKFTEDENLSYKHLIQMILNKPPQGGFTLSDIRDRDKIEKAIKEAKAGLILLEDKEFDVLLGLANAMQWPFRDIFIADFIDSLKDVKSVKPLTVEEISKNGQAKELEVV